MSEIPRWQHRGRGDSSGESVNVQQFVANSSAESREVGESVFSQSRRRRRSKRRWTRRLRRRT